MFNNEVQELKANAETARAKLLHGVIDYKTAKEMTEPYIDAVNAKSKEIAKKYNMRPKLVSVKAFLR